MKVKIMVAVATLLMAWAANGLAITPDSIAARNTQRSMALLDNVMAKFCNSGNRHIAMSYNSVSHKAERGVGLGIYSCVRSC